MRIPSRCTFWLSTATLLLAVVAYAWFIAPRSQITQANFDRIHEGMNRSDTEKILGKPDMHFCIEGWDIHNIVEPVAWRQGPDSIHVTFTDSKVSSKDIYVASAWELFRWYARKGAEKIGIK
jgi:hypothetical protein